MLLDKVDITLISLLGVLVGILISTALVVNIDKNPVEGVMVEKCDSVSSVLVSYDRGDFLYSNGTSFKRVRD